MDSHALLVGMHNDTVSLKKCLAVSYKVKCIPIIQPSNLTPRHSPKSNRKICPHKDLCADVYSKIIHSHIFLTAQIGKQPKWSSISEWTNEL